MTPDTNADKRGQTEETKGWWADEGGYRFEFALDSAGAMKITVVMPDGEPVQATLANFRVSQLRDWLAPDHALAALMPEVEELLAVFAVGYMPDDVQEVANRDAAGWLEGYDGTCAAAAALLARIQNRGEA